MARRDSGALIRWILVTAGLLSAAGCRQSMAPNLGAAMMPGQVAAYPSMAPVLRKVTPAVVTITSVSDVADARHAVLDDPDLRRFLDRSGVAVPDGRRTLRRQRAGSGVIWDGPRGLVLTNAHLARGADRILVTLQDGQAHAAEVVGMAEDADIAVLRIVPVEAPRLRLGTSERLEVGDFVMVVGNPFGIGQSATSGIVSAVGRVHREADGLGPLIQTDASINPGNSGGPLINMAGEVIGITSALVGPDAGNVGIGFAVPIERAEQAVREILKRP
ncbi:trypsin-like peptidase domain-containing protein [Thiohalocapsa marina]|uniref:trypsin-like peptidase domain-containing protein n=1 Tax=Thiohalocapsa marina TaxID=424902 RepID=UPI0036DADA35